MPSDENDRSLKQSTQPQGSCNECGRAINEVSEKCATCMRESREHTTFADFGGGLDAE